MYNIFHKNKNNYDIVIKKLINSNHILCIADNYYTIANHTNCQLQNQVRLKLFLQLDYVAFLCFKSGFGQ